MDDEMGEEEELEEYEGEVGQLLQAPSCRLTPAHIAFDLTELAASLCSDWARFFANVTHDVAAHIDYESQRRAFHEEAAREIETIIEEAENAHGE